MYLQTLSSRCDATTQCHSTDLAHVRLRGLRECVLVQQVINLEDCTAAGTIQVHKSNQLRTVSQHDSAYTTAHK
jgi:hypothetical protein